jgi:hypothetical protein
MTKYKELFLQHGKQVDIKLQEIVTKLTTTTDFKNDQVDILISLGLIGKFNSDLVSLLANDAPKHLVAQFVNEDPAELYKVSVSVSEHESSCNGEPTKEEKQIDAITELVGILEELTKNAQAKVKG